MKRKRLVLKQWVKDALVIGTFYASIIWGVKVCIETFLGM